MVNPRKILTLTDFVESTFAGENAKNPGFYAKMTFNSRRVYHSNLNYTTALRKSARRYETSIGFPRKCARAPGRRGALGAPTLVPGAMGRFGNLEVLKISPQPFRIPPKAGFILPLLQ